MFNINSLQGVLLVGLVSILVVTLIEFLSLSIIWLMARGAGMSVRDFLISRLKQVLGVTVLESTREAVDVRLSVLSRRTRFLKRRYRELAPKDRVVGPGSGIMLNGLKVATDKKGRLVSAG